MPTTHTLAPGWTLALNREKECVTLRGPKYKQFTCTGPDAPDSAGRLLYAMALDLAAAPQVAAPADEREAFESWAVANGYDVSSSRFGAPLGHELDYDKPRTDLMWKVWQARAALAAAPAAPGGVPEAPRIDVDELANHIRCVDGWHKMGAGALAEKIAEWLEARHAPVDGGAAGVREAERRYHYLLGFLIEKGVLTDARYGNGTWVLRGIYGIDDSGLNGAGRTAEEAIDNAILMSSMDPAAAEKHRQAVHAGIGADRSARAGAPSASGEAAS